MLSKGVCETYRDREPALFAGGAVHDDRREELRDEPAGADRPLRTHPGNEYEFLFITKGGRIGQQDVPLPADQGAAQRRRALTKFIRTAHHGTSARRPVRRTTWRIVIGGTSAEANLSTVKKASAGYLDHLPTVGQRGGARASATWNGRRRSLKICQESGVGAQFGGKYLVHDVRVIRAAAPCRFVPRGHRRELLAPTATSRRRSLAEGIFLEQLGEESRPVPAEAGSGHVSRPSSIDLRRGDGQGARDSDEVSGQDAPEPASGTLIVARDIAHARIKQMLDEGQADARLFQEASGLLRRSREDSRRGWLRVQLRPHDRRPYGSLRRPVPDRTAVRW